MSDVNLLQSKDTRYTVNGYGAVSGLQTFNYSYSANEEHLEEIGNINRTDTATEPETSVSFEVTDTGSLASLLARMRYDYSTQDYQAGVTTDLNSNAFSLDEDDLQYLITTFGEYKAPGGTFKSATLFPYTFVNSINISLSADNVGSVNVDAAGTLFKPIYKPYHTTRAYPAQYVSSGVVEIGAGWSVSSGTHELLNLEVNNSIFDDDVLSWSGSQQVTISSGTVTADDRLMLWAFEKTPGSLPSIDYANSIRFVKPDRINIWLMPDTASPTDANNFLRVQSVDVTVDLARDQLREIAKNDLGTSMFYQAPRYPLDITGQVRILENTLDKWAELQGKTLNESATTGSIDSNNILDITSWDDAKLVVKWYKYGNDSPVQTMTLGQLRFTGYDSTQDVGGRKEATWNISTSDFSIEGFDV